MPSERNGQQTVDAALATSLEWRCIGPHRGGRVVAVAADPNEPMTFYFGACAGGVWKTTDGGTYWENVSDGFFKTAAVGAIAVAAVRPERHLRRHGRDDDSRQRLARRRRLQVHRRRQDLDEHRPGGDPPHRQDPRPPDEPRHRLRRRARPRLGAEHGARRLPLEGRRQDLGAGALPRRGHRRDRPRDGPEQPARPLRRHLGGAALPAWNLIERRRRAAASSSPPTAATPGPS